MIQRLQTFWLLLASVCAFLSMRFSFFSGADPLVNYGKFSAVNNMILLVLTAVLGTLCLFTIFVFKQRKLQLWLTILAIVLSGLAIFLYFDSMKDYPNSVIALTSVFVFLIPLFLIFAARGIYKDHKLVRSMDRLR